MVRHDPRLHGTVGSRNVSGPGRPRRRTSRTRARRPSGLRVSYRAGRAMEDAKHAAENRSILENFPRMRRFPLSDRRALRRAVACRLGRMEADGDGKPIASIVTAAALRDTRRLARRTSECAASAATGTDKSHMRSQCPNYARLILECRRTGHTFEIMETVLQYGQEGRAKLILVILEDRYGRKTEMSLARPGLNDIWTREHAIDLACRRLVALLKGKNKST